MNRLGAFFPLCLNVAKYVYLLGLNFLFLDFSYHIKEVPLYFLFAKEFIMKHCGTEFCEMHFCISCYDHVDYNGLN